MKKKVKMTKKESQFLTELRKSLEREGVFFHKITDLPQSWTRNTLRFDKPKPFDAFASIWGTAVAIEAKVIPKYQAFGLGQLRDSQMRGLQAMTDSGGKAFVFLNVRGNGRGRLNRVIIFNWETFARRKTSIKKRELETLPYIESKKGLFDLRKWVDSFL